MSKYSMTVFGRQTIALLDHLGVERAVVGGTSLGANATLEAAVQPPSACRD
jgi:pimeloyl-ACP methyl ester carboxylesterase